MAPFDCSQIEAESAATVAWDASIETSVRSAAGVNSTRAPRLFPAHQVYTLTNDPARAAVLEDGVYASSMRTTSYAEYLLQRLDTNATMSSVAFILLYAGLLHIM